MTVACRRCRLKNVDRALFCFGCGSFLGAGKLDLQRYRPVWFVAVLVCVAPLFLGPPPPPPPELLPRVTPVPTPTPVPWLRRDVRPFDLREGLAKLGGSPAALLPGILVFPLEQADGAIAPDGLLIAEMAMFHSIHRPRKRRSLEFERVLEAFEEAGLYGDQPVRLADDKARLRLLARLKLRHNVVSRSSAVPGGRKIHLVVHGPEGNREFERTFLGEDARFVPAWIVHAMDDPWARPGEEIRVQDLMYPPSLSAAAYSRAAQLVRRTSDAATRAKEWKLVSDHETGSAFPLAQYLRLVSHAAGREPFAAFQAGTTRFPDHHYVRFLTSRYLAGRGRFHTSMRIQLELLEEDRLDPVLHRALRENLMRLGHHAAAAEVLDRAAAWNPRAAWAHLERGILEVTRARRALTLDTPGSTPTSRWQAYLEAAAEARRSLTRAYNLDTQDVEIAIWMIHALAGVPGSGAEMEVWYARGAALDPASVALQRAREAYLASARH